MLRPIIILYVIFLAAVSSLHAAPAAPHLHELEQPDGSKIPARQWGDERSHGWEADSGHTIVFDDKIKGWAYAVHDKLGRLTSSSVLFKSSAAEAPAGIKKSLRPLKAVTSGMRSPAVSSVSQTAPQAAPLLAAPVVGTKSFPVIMIKYSDVAFTRTKADFDNLLFGDTGNTVKNYFLENSYGQLTINGGNSGVYGPVTSNNTRLYYGGGTDQYAGTLVYEAVAKAAAAGLEFAPFVDQSKSCYVDVVAIVHPGTGEESGFDQNDVWSNSWNLNDAYYFGNSSNGEFVTNEPCALGGFIKVNNYTIQPELAVPNGTQVGAGVFVHELCHAAGLFDLYDTDGSSNGVGYWSVMSNGMWLGKAIAFNLRMYSTGDTPAHLDPWSKYYLGWIGPVNITGVNANMPVAAASGGAPIFYKIGSGTPDAGEYFLVENRQKTGFDAYLPGPGLFIWHVDGTTITNLSTDNMVNANECRVATAGVCASPSSHYGVAVIQADGLLSLENKVNLGNAGDAYLLPNTLTDSTVPHTKFWSGSASGYGVTSISLSAATMTAKLIGPPIAPSISTTAASSVGITSAALNGTVNDNNSPTTVSFEYGADTGYGNTLAATTGGNISAGTGPTFVSVTMSTLVCNTTYHYRVKAVNTVETSYGNDMTFTTTPCVPGTPVINSISAGNGLVSISFVPPTYSGVSAITGYTAINDYGQEYYRDGITIPLTVPLLTNGTEYRYRISAKNSAGSGTASDESVVVTPGIAVTEGAYETGYQSIQSAYDKVSDMGVIRLVKDLVLGELKVDMSNSKGRVTVAGGYNNSLALIDGTASVINKVTLSAGKTNFQNVVVRSPQP